MPGRCTVLFVERAGQISQFARPLIGGQIAEAGHPADYTEIVQAVGRHRPEVVLVDLEAYPREALEAIGELMSACPTPVLVVSGQAVKADAIRALAAGALDVVERPAQPTEEFFERLTAQVLLLARVKVMPHLKGRRRARRAPFRLVAIASSLGGPKALVELLSGLPKSFHAPVVICQHITAGFADDLARWLSAETGRDVSEITAAAPLEADRVFIAGAHAHLVVRPDFSLAVDPGEAVGGFRPSCDVLLRSVAASFAEAAIGVVLTGMGKDGARGLKEIRAQGGHTIAQDEATSVVFGMPGEAIALGAAEKILPLDQIADQLTRWA